MKNIDTTRAGDSEHVGKRVTPVDQNIPPKFPDPSMKKMQKFSPKPGQSSAV